jgi:tetratricopeptide (TPR) repeat protein
MGLAGELSTIGLAEVFQNLAFNHLTGTLTIKQGRGEAHVRFEDGRIKAFAPLEPIDYVELARWSGAASEDALAKAAGTNRRRTLKAYLAAMGDFNEAAYDQAVATQVEELLLPLFGLKNGSFSFAEGAAKKRLFDKDQSDCGIDLEPQSVAMEAARRHDEWQTLEHLIPARKEILVPTDGDFEEQLDDAAATMHYLCDGTRRLGEAVQQSSLKEYDALTTVARLIEAGRLVVAEPADLVALAQRARMAGDITLALTRLELAVELDGSDVEARRELVRLYERAGRNADAAYGLVTLASMLKERGDVESAREAQERASIVAPGNLDVLEKGLRFFESLGEKTRALRSGQSLADALVREGLFEDALPLYERLLQESPRSESLRVALARCMVQLDQPEHAVQHLLGTADDAFDMGDLPHARRLYREVLTITPDNAEAQARIDDIESGVAQRRTARRRLLKVILAAVVVLALVGWQVAREWRAETALVEAGQEAAMLLGDDNADRVRIEALERYARVAHAHPFTRGAQLARATVDTLLSREIREIESALKLVPSARNTADIEFSLGRARAQLERLKKVSWPSGVAERWDGEHARLLKRVRLLSR